MGDELRATTSDQAGDNGVGHGGQSSSASCLVCSDLIFIKFRPMSLFCVWNAVDYVRVGGSFVQGSDPRSNVSLDQILSNVSLCWFTNIYPTSLCHYRTAYERYENRSPQPGQARLDKPLGYSQFPREMLPTRASWVREKANLVFRRRHEIVTFDSLSTKIE